MKTFGLGWGVTECTGVAVWTEGLLMVFALPANPDKSKTGCCLLWMLYGMEQGGVACEQLVPVVHCM